ncbi:hypothetical protein N0V95_000975 [Ascochyta clinopodiicola]|nr:hypothetical protein N0V95_000975 [Ascochyta clinopodiicola]
MAVDNASQEDLQCNAVCDLHYNLTRAPEGRARDIYTSKSIYHNGDDQVHRDIRHLQHDERFWKLGRIPKLGDEGEESHMASIGKDDVGHSQKGWSEAR